MVLLPPTIAGGDGTPIEQRAAAYLESVVNHTATDGWEFYRVDPIGVQVRPGCIGALLGVPVTTVSYHVITFRKLIR